MYKQQAPLFHSDLTFLSLTHSFLIFLNLSQTTLVSHIYVH